MRLITLVPPLILLISVMGQSSAGDLSPAVSQALPVPVITAKQMEQNAFAGFMAIDAPVGMNPQKVGEKMLADALANYQEGFNTKNIRQALLGINQQDYYLGQKEVKLASYTFPCQRSEKNCIQKIMAQKAKFAPFIKESILLKRYQTLIHLPAYYSSPNTLLSSSALAQYMRLLQLRLREAVYYIEEGEVDKGLDVLAADVRFAKRSIANPNQYINYIDFGVFNVALKRIYFVVASLLDSPQMANQLHHPKLLTLLDSFSQDQQQLLFTALTNIRNQDLRTLSMIANNPYDVTFFGLTQEEIEQLNQDDNSAVRLLDIEQTMNLYYQQMSSYLTAAKLVLPYSAGYYQDVLALELSTPPLTLKEITTLYGKENVIGRYYIQSAMDNRIRYLFLRQYDVISYLHLVQVKLKIKQAGISKEEVPAFLQKFKDLAKNPYSQEPISWDSEQQTLSYQWLEGKEALAQGFEHKRAIVTVSF